LADAEGMEGYRIRIFSDGLKKEEAPNKNLITELGKTVGQVEGFIDKLDDEFVEIQDKKERFFSTLTSRKGPSIEKQ
jgi:starvation-inducible outer membrane lipoprotein